MLCELREGDDKISSPMSNGCSFLSHDSRNNEYAESRCQLISVYLLNFTRGNLRSRDRINRASYKLSFTALLLK